MTEATKGERTKKKLVDATASLMRRQGYHATGLSAIVDESGAPRGSLYFYFPGGKDELAVAAIEASGVEWRAKIEGAIAGATDLGTAASPGSAGARNNANALCRAIDAIVHVLADDLAASNWQNGCPVAAVALEATSDVVTNAVVKHYASWQENIVERLAHFGIAKAAAAQLAVVALSAIEGALLLARVQRSKGPLLAVGAALRAMAQIISKPEPSTKRGRRL